MDDSVRLDPMEFSDYWSGFIGLGTDPVFVGFSKCQSQRTGFCCSSSCSLLPFLVSRRITIVLFPLFRSSCHWPGHSTQSNSPSRSFATDSDLLESRSHRKKSYRFDYCNSRWSCSTVQRQLYQFHLCCNDYECNIRSRSIIQII